MKFVAILVIYVAFNSALSLNIPPTLYPGEIDDDYTTDTMQLQPSHFSERNYPRKSMDGFETSKNDHKYPLRHFKNRKPLLSIGKRRFREFVPSTFKDSKKSVQKRIGEEMNEDIPFLMQFYQHEYPFIYAKRNDGNTDDYRQLFRDRLWKKMKSQNLFKGRK